MTLTRTILASITFLLLVVASWGQAAAPVAALRPKPKAEPARPDAGAVQAKAAAASGKTKTTTPAQKPGTGVAEKPKSAGASATVASAAAPAKSPAAAGTGKAAGNTSTSSKLKRPKPNAAKPMTQPAAAASGDSGASGSREASIAPAKKFRAAGKRDPFTSVIKTGGGLRLPECASGKKCLVVGDLVLKGIVKHQAGMLAVVENQYRKAYFLREDDPVFNGAVVRITGDSIVFREKVLDKLGHEKTRDVVKRIAGSKPVV